MIIFVWKMIIIRFGGHMGKYVFISLGVPIRQMALTGRN